MASLPLSRNYTYTSTDTDDSDADSAMLASCSLQEIRQEDLAAILPDQQDCDAFGGFGGRADGVRRVRATRPAPTWSCRSRP